MRRYIAIFAIFSAQINATEDLCYQQGADAPHIFNQTMDQSVYSVVVNDNGNEDPTEVLISVPLEYEAIPIEGITVQLGGYNGFSTDIAIMKNSGKGLGGFYISKAQLSDAKIFANYRSTKQCDDIQITTEFVSYNVPLSHNR